MNIAIIGASRGIGLEILSASLKAGHEITVLARHPEKITISDPKLNILKGDIRDFDSVKRSINGKDAVILSVGVSPTLKPIDVFSKGTRNVINAIGKNISIKLVVITGIGAGDSKGHGGFLYDRIVNPLLLKTVYLDKDISESLLKASGLNWMIVRPGFLINGPRTGQYRVIDDLTGVKAGKISRADVADFILCELHNPTHFGKTPLITY